MEMTRRIVIEENNVQFIRQSTLKDLYITEVSASNLLKHVVGTDEILPDGTKYFKKLGYKSYVLGIQHPPHIRTIMVSMGLSHRWNRFKQWAEEERKKKAIGYMQRKFKRKTFNLARYKFTLLMPYIFYIIYMDTHAGMLSLGVVVSNKSINSMKEDCYICPFYNMATTHKVCMNIGEIYSNVKSLSLADGANAVISHFWQTEFNSDYDYNVKKYKYIPEYSNFFIWDYLTETDPERMMRAFLVRYQQIENVIHNMKGGRDGLIRSSRPFDVYNYMINMIPPGTGTRKKVPNTKKEAPKKRVVKKKTAKKKLS